MTAVFDKLKICDADDVSPQSAIDTLINSLNLFQSTGKIIFPFFPTCLT